MFKAHLRPKIQAASSIQDLFSRLERCGCLKERQAKVCAHV
jgi:hypothetical protein